MKLKYGPYSPSRLETATCPYSFYRQYVDTETRVKRTEGVAQARGSVVHEVFEKITESIRMAASGKEVRISPGSLQTWVAQAITRHPAAQQEVREILDMVTLYVNKPPKVLTENAAVEQKMATKVEDGIWVEAGYNDPEALVRGRADIFFISDDTTTAYLYDHKTQPNKEEADTFQLGVYAWVISKIYPFLDEVRTVLHFARYGFYSSDVIWVKNEEIRKSLIARGEDAAYVINLEHLEDELMTRIAIIESMPEWHAVPHKGCQYCPVLADCPEMKEVVQFDSEGRMHARSPFVILGDTSKAVKVAGYINILETLVKNLKDDLKEHVKASGAIAIPGKIYCFKGEEVVDWDVVNKRLKTSVYDILERHGVDPREFMGFSQTFSKGLPFHSNGELVTEVLNILPKKLTNEFRGVKN